MKPQTEPAFSRIIPSLHDGKQIHKNYTEEDNLVWSILFKRQIEKLQTAACLDYNYGVTQIGFTEFNIPNFEKINRILKARTGWQIVGVPGIVDDSEFFRLMAEKKFPATTWLRTMQQLDYLEEPDMFHDVFAHVPLLLNKDFSRFLNDLSKIAVRFLSNPQAIEFLSRVYWYTIEFGLIAENGRIAVYGAGILSSLAETKYCLEHGEYHRKFDIEKIFHTSYRKDAFQNTYFIIDSLSQLNDSISLIDRMMDDYFPNQIAKK